MSTVEACISIKNLVVALLTRAKCHVVILNQFRKVVSCHLATVIRSTHFSPLAGMIDDTQLLRLRYVQLRIFSVNGGVLECSRREIEGLSLQLVSVLVAALLRHFSTFLSYLEFVEPAHVVIDVNKIDHALARLWCCTAPHRR